MKDRREYAMFAVDLPSNPKMAGASPLTRWLDVCAVLYAARHFTDGHVHGKSVLAEAGVPKKHLADLINRNRLHPVGHECERCPQPREDGWLYVHDYLVHQRSASQAKAQREAGRKGARARWDADRNADRIPDGNAETYAESESEALVAKEVSHPHVADASPVDDDDVDLTVISKALGGCDEHHARKVAHDILSRAGKSVGKPTGYVLRSIGSEPARYKPGFAPDRLPPPCPHGRKLACAACGNSGRSHLESA